MLIHIGYHRAGSTWLQYHFNKSESGFRLYPHAKSDRADEGTGFIHSKFTHTHAFDFDPALFRRRFDAWLTETSTVNQKAVLSCEGLSGHWFSGGYNSKEIADRLLDTFPEAKILICIREQHKILSSVYRQYVRKGGGRSLKEFIHPPAAGRNRAPHFSMNHFMYDRTIDYYQTLFGTNNVKVLPIETIVENPVSAFQEIQQFAGLSVSPAFWVEETARNVGIAAAEAYVKRRLNPFLRRDLINDYSILVNRYTKPIARGIYYVAIRTISRKRKARAEQTLNEEIQKLVGSRYSESNSNTARLTGIDLHRLGYK